MGRKGEISAHEELPFVVRKRANTTANGYEKWGSEIGLYYRYSIIVFDFVHHKGAHQRTEAINRAEYI